MILLSDMSKEVQAFCADINESLIELRSNNGIDLTTKQLYSQESTTQIFNNTNKSIVIIIIV